MFMKIGKRSLAVQVGKRNSMVIFHSILTCLVVELIQACCQISCLLSIYKFVTNRNCRGQVWFPFQPSRSHLWFLVSSCISCDFWLVGMKTCSYTSLLWISLNIPWQKVFIDQKLKCFGITRQSVTWSNINRKYYVHDQNGSWSIITLVKA